MADISTHIENIQKASRGEAVRDAIIDALNAVNQLGTNANTLDGHPAEDFVTSASLQSSMETIGNTIDTINGTIISGGVSTKLAETSAAKKEIEAAITDKGVSIASDATFRSYADSIREISGASDLESIDITENGDYEAQANGIAGWNYIHVDTTAGLTELNITQNGTYTAESEGVTGFKSVTVNVAAPVGSTGPFTVRFMSEDGTTILRTVTGVRGGGYAEYTGPTPTSSTSGVVFTGWDPSPYNITGDTWCYPLFIDPGSQVAGEIPDSWDTIISNGGASYAIGAYKTIGFLANDNILIPYGRYDTRAAVNGAIGCMKKVANGEAGTTSTWIMKAYPQFTFKNGTVPGYGNRLTYMLNKYPDRAYGKWVDSDLRQWLNGEFLSKMMPSNLRNAIRSVMKYTWCWDQSVNGYRQLTSIDKIWIPSFREVHMNGQSPDDSIMSGGYCETSGMEYYKNETSVDKRYLYMAGSNGLPSGNSGTSVRLRGGASTSYSYNFTYGRVLGSNGIIQDNSGLRVDLEDNGEYANGELFIGFCL